MLISYEDKFGYSADFRVRYRFYSMEEGGRRSLPFQGYHSDFWYDNPVYVEGCIFMIYPEFEDKEGNVITNKTSSVPEQGTARMWILVPERRAFRKKWIRIGLTGYFMEGSKKVAECEVIEVIGLNTNPTGP